MFTKEVKALGVLAAASADGDVPAGECRRGSSNGCRFCRIGEAERRELPITVEGPTNAIDGGGDGGRRKRQHRRQFRSILGVLAAASANGDAPERATVGRFCRSCEAERRELEYSLSRLV